jgi:hypothetical protein
MLMGKFTSNKNLFLTYAYLIDLYVTTVYILSYGILVSLILANWSWPLNVT